MQPRKRDQSRPVSATRQGGAAAQAASAIARPRRREVRPPAWFDSGMIVVLAVMTVAAGGLAPVSRAADAPNASVHEGQAVKVGNGTARVVVAATANGLPASVSVVMTAGALEGLPAPSKEQPEWEFVLPMPQSGPRTGYDHVAVDWNPAGHPPEGIYTVPHFDFHFYAVSRAEQEGVSFAGTEGAEAAKVADSALLPQGYAVPPDTAVEKMGVHGVDPASPEFHGEPFTRTFIYGYYKGRLTFVEPMVALSYLLTEPDVTDEVRVPSAYSYPGFYPSKYRVGYDPERKLYFLSLMGLHEWSPGSEETATQ
jgi:hypothetical protein